MEIAQAFLTYDSIKLNIIDVPGQKQYTEQMVMGATCASVAVFVVSCLKNDCEKNGNLTLANEEVVREQLAILKGSYMKEIVVAINKMDSVRWSKTRFD